MSLLVPMFGQRRGLLVVVAPAKMNAGASAWLCQCDCGGTIVALGSRLRNGRVRSCGCLRNRKPEGQTLGMWRSPEYRAWSGAISRCKPGAPGHEHYHDRGIKVCQEWRDSFLDFLAHVGPRPSDEHSLDRIDNDRGYEPGNVRWATSTVQINNRRTVTQLQARITKLEADNARLRELAREAWGIAG